MDIIEYKPPHFEEVEITQNFIDLKKIIASKNKFVPPFFLSFLKRLLHIKDVNLLIYNNRDVFGVDFATAVLNDLQIRTVVVNPQNIPVEGRYIFAANHPLGGIDGMILISEVGERIKNILFPVNDVLMNLPGLRSVYVPINKYGSNTKNQDYLNNAFASDKNILYFPAGLCSRKIKGEIIDLEWKKTFIKKAVESQRDIIPVYIDAKNSNRFYNFANFRKRIGIKANIELLLLPSELFKQKGKTVHITFGAPIPYSTFTKLKKENQWAKLVKEYVYKLKDNPQAIFNY